MSRSETQSDDDEFESADEGDESTEESCSVDESSTPDEKVLEIQPECILLNEEEEIKKGVIQNKLDTPPMIEAIHVDCSSSKESPKCEVETVSDSSLAGVMVENINIPNTGIISEKSTEDTKVSQQEEIIPAAQLPINEIIDVTDSEIKAVNETAVSAEKPCENFVEVPSEIANKLSTTRSIPNRGKIRSKPSLGAKKLGLGAVKLTQTPESLIPALEKLDSRETSECSDYQTTPQQVNL